MPPAAAEPPAVIRPAPRVERLAYTRSQAAEALGVSRSTFIRRVLPHVETIEMPWGTRLIPVDELERLLAERRRPAKPRPSAALRGRPRRLPEQVVERIQAAHTAGRSLGEIARHLDPTSKTLGDREPGLSVEGWFRVKHQTYPYGIHFAVVKVDRDTGGVKVERYVIAYDIGRAINPALVRGQIVGGFAQGLGGALLEEFTYNERGDPLATTFADYLMPTVAETPEVDVLLREDYVSPLNPLGIKGAGESGITGVGAAIASAIDDAIGMPGAVTQLPVTPQRLKQILNGRR